ncbi:MAG: hypothetical protein ACYCYP_12125 [Leptospirales bacterium]
MEQGNWLVRGFALMIPLVLLDGCAETDSLIGDHQTAPHHHRIQGLSLENQSVHHGSLSNYLDTSNLYSDAVRAHPEAAREASVLGNIVKARKEYRMVVYDFIKPSDETLGAGDFICESHS